MGSKQEMRSLAEGFAKSGMTRQEYCARHGVAMRTLDYWRRAHRKQKPKLVEVDVEQARPTGGFALMLANGRRIESSWSFSTAEMEKRIRACSVWG